MNVSLRSGKDLEEEDDIDFDQKPKFYLFALLKSPNLAAFLRR